MPARVSIDIADASQSVTATVKRLLGDAGSISSDDVHLLGNGWVRLRRERTNLYISPHAIESILIENGDLSDGGGSLQYPPRPGSHSGDREDPARK